MALNGFLLDTHIWLWYLSEGPSLPRKSRKIIQESAAVCWLSPVSIWEVGILAHRGRIQFKPDLRSWVHRARYQFQLKDAPLNQEVALISHEIELPDRDPADHLLAATALVYDLALVTVDRHLR